MLGHVPRNFLLALSGYNYSASVTIGSYFAKMMIFHTMIYPILTIQRRLECQTTKRHTMLPVRYNGYIHGLNFIFYEEGMKGLYRGFCAYLIPTSCYVVALPLLVTMMDILANSR